MGQPDVGDVHISTAIARRKKRKKLRQSLPDVILKRKPDRRRKG